MATFTQKEQNELQQALMLCQEGRLKEGKAYLDGLYRSFPRYPSILTPLGTIAIQEGHLEDGIQKLEVSLKIDPKQPSALNNLGNAYIQLKKNKEAIDAFRKAIKINPEFIDAYYNEGRAHSALKEYDKALSLYNLTLQKEPQHLWAYISQGYCQHQLEKYDEALSSYDAALKIYTPIAELHFNRGLTQAKLNLYVEAIQSFNYVIQLNPNYKDIYIYLGEVLEKLGEIDQAQQSYKYALKIDPNNLDIYALIFATYYRLNDDKSFHTYIEEALKLDPKFEPALLAKGELFIRQGDYEKSFSTFSVLINNKSEYSAQCYAKISASKKFVDPSEPLIEEMKSLLKDPKQKNKASLNFALGKIYEDLKLYDEAFIYYKEANRSNLKDDYDINKEIEAADKIIDQFDLNFTNKLGKCASESVTPVIILGMPRSGTSLTEQIISSHPSVRPAGELNFWQMPKIEVIKATSKDAWQDIAEKYINLLKKVAQADSETLRITDKMPHNFFNLGMIASIFPKAKLVHCKRYPIDNCWSIFSLPFNQNHGYAQNLEYLGKYYLIYHKLMSHWESLFPGRIMHIDYEKTVQDPEYWSKKLIEHIGLPWDEACLSPHKNKRNMRTFSQWQVRQPIYKTSVRRSDHFVKNLQSLRDILEKGKVDLS
jgi:tetratricopeptide (TPR) repeat protein